MTVPLCSITICTYNSLPFLTNAVYSALNQTFDAFELLILNDGSTDSTAQYLSTLRQHPKVRVFSSENRRGIIASRNFILKRARGKYVSILDADDEFTPEKLTRHCEILERDPSVGVVWGSALAFAQEPFSLPSFIPPLDYQHGWDLVSQYLVVHSATTWRKSSIEEVGGYDSELTCEECPDLFLKVGDRYEQYFDPAIAAIKHLRRSGFTRDFFLEKGAQVSRRLLSQAIQRRHLKTISL